MKLLIFSDIHGDQPALEKLMATEADYYFAAGDLANWGRGLDALGPILQMRGERVYIIPGNHESESDITGFCRTYGFHDFHGRSVQIDGHTIAGLGYSSPTPFDTPGEYTEEELAARLAKLSNPPPRVLICHAPPKNTKLDRVSEHRHFGSQAIRNFIEQAQPEHFYCGHIHEAAGQQDTIGRSRGWNVGKSGQLLDLDSLVK
jgi:Icc-related predicted phosphoesterase